MDIKILRLGYLYAFLTAVIFSVHYITAKIVLTEVQPLALSATRGIIGGIIILSIYYKKSKNYFKIKYILKVVPAAFLGFFINQIFFLYGLKATDPLNASIINNTIPLVSTLLGILYGMDKYSIKKISGIFLGLLMVITLSFVSSAADQFSFAVGDLLIFCNVLALCFSFILAKKTLEAGIPNEFISGFILLIGGLFCLVFSFNDLPNVYEYTFSNNKQLFIMLFEVLISTALVYLLNFKALKILTPGKTTVFGYLHPLFTAILNFFIFGIIPKLAVIPIFLLIILAGQLVIRSKD